MSPRLVVITGGMRTGGSAVAELVHRMGFPVATAIMAPIPPHWWSDWEDREASSQFARWGMPWQEPNGEEFINWFDGYSGGRGAAARQVRERAGEAYLGFAVKSPMYAPFLDEVREVARSAGHEPFVIETIRRSASRRASVARLAGITGVPVEKLDIASDRLAAAAEVMCPNLIVPYEQLVAEPFITARRIAEAIGAPLSLSGIDAASACITTRRY